jgi:hypothetical protein
MVILLFILILVIVLLTFGIVKLYKNSNIVSPRLSELAAAFQNITVVISILAAGLWAIYTFDALNQRQEAELKYRELQKKIEDTESSTIKLGATIVNYKSSVNNGQTGLIIEVTITNKGTTRIEYDLSKSPLKIYKVEAQGDKMGYSTLLEPTLFSVVAPLGQKEIKSTPLQKWVSLTESSRTLSYFVTVDTESLYYIVFSSPNMKTDEKEVESSTTKCSPEDDCMWFVSKYMYVEKH